MPNAFQPIQTSTLKSSLIKREIFPQILKHLQHPEITMLIGPRQAGKTTLMLLLQEHLKKQKKPTLFLNLDIQEDLDFIKDQTAFINRLTNKFKGRHAYIFIDEIQRLPDAGIFIKGIYDKRLPYKFIISGSGSLELKQKIYESLTGRKLVFEVLPLTFREFIDFKNNYEYTESIIEFFRLYPTQANRLLNEYLLYGGYPRVVLEYDENFKCMYLKEIFNSYMLKDITELLQIQRKEKFSLLTSYLGLNIGILANKTKMAQQIGLNFETLENYLWYLENTFIIEKIKPYYTNPRKELIKQPIYYFLDLGLRNYLTTECHLNVEYDDFLFQNFVFLLLKSQKPFKINYWRTKDKAEIDFVLRLRGKIIPIEVKNANLNKLPSLRSIKSFINKYSPEIAIIVNKKLETTLQINNTKVMILPYFYLLSDITQLLM